MNKVKILCDVKPDWEMDYKKKELLGSFYFKIQLCVFDSGLHFHIFFEIFYAKWIYVLQPFG